MNLKNFLRNKGFEFCDVTSNMNDVTKYVFVAEKGAADFDESADYLALLMEHGTSFSLNIDSSGKKVVEEITFELVQVTTSHPIFDDKDLYVFKISLAEVITSASGNVPVNPPSSDVPFIPEA